MCYNIRNVKENESSLIRELASRCEPLDIHTPYTYWLICNLFNQSTFVMEDDKKIIGYIMCIHTEDTLFIWQIGIEKDYRKKGLSTKLIDEVIKFANKKNINKISTTINKDNKVSFYAFSNYCAKNNLQMKSVSEINIKDLIDKNFNESEVFYEIEKADTII